MPTEPRRKAGARAVAVQRKKFKLDIITVAAIIFLTLMLIALTYNLIKLGVAKSQLNTWTAKNAEIDRAIENNYEDLSYYETKEFIDRYAREQLNMRGKGEITFIGK